MLKPTCHKPDRSTRTIYTDGFLSQENDFRKPNRGERHGSTARPAIQLSINFQSRSGDDNPSYVSRIRAPSQLLLNSCARTQTGNKSINFHAATRPAN